MTNQAISKKNLTEENYTEACSITNALNNDFHLGRSNKSSFFQNPSPSFEKQHTCTQKAYSLWDS